jgi:bacterioferritin (cytochrome b1)
MKAGKGVVDALNECLRRERALADVFEAYHEYWERWRFHRLCRWSKQLRSYARDRIDAIEDRIERLDSEPTFDRTPWEFVPVEDAEDISKVWGMVLGLLEDAAECYEEGRKACKDADDTTSAKVCTSGRKGVEDAVWRVEAKINKVHLIGPERYLAHHMHDVG